ncbi:ap-4 complex subunit epsilon-1 [Anaeramoeba flamelloides]|uniref:Ap-4 complex subunit epsilon-1 n=1 Tax=Anaeramoeba flamelloides TaxID=1746091 RepID=A0AAV7ZQW3_9EUKA|nr:ap-4 complex subunit epsilon-1 [Anaeramoeba flamelloides]
MVTTIVNSIPPSYLSKDFVNLIKEVGESKSKLEEDRLIKVEITKLKKLFSKPKLKPRKRCELVIRALFCELLGNDVEFAHVKAVNSSQESNLFFKRVGYLAASTFLHSNQKLFLLMINTIQKDLKSTSPIVVCSALITITKLITPEFIPAVLPKVLELLSHEDKTIRKKAVAAMYTFLLKDPKSLNLGIDDFKRVLCDQDPSVMGAALDIFLLLAKTNPRLIKSQIPTICSILKQVIEGRLNKDFDYHQIHAPWIQIKILKILGYLGQDDLKASKEMYNIIIETTKKAEIGFLNGITAACGIMYECIRTITKIYPEQKLLNAASEEVGKFVTSSSNNLRYLGITALIHLVKAHPEAAVKHQIVIVECLDDPDETLRRNTISLLFEITNSTNIVFILQKMLTYLKTVTDLDHKKDLVTRMVKLSEDYAIDTKWFVSTINSIMELAGSLVPRDVVYNVMRLIAEGTEDDEDEDEDEKEEEENIELKKFAAQEYAEMLLSEQILPDMSFRLIIWVIGEYSYLCKDEFPIKDLMLAICLLVEKPNITDQTRAICFTALTKMVAQSGIIPEEVDDLVDKYSNSRSTDIQQRCYELRGILANTDIIDEILPPDASNEDLDFDIDLSFLNEYVQMALQNGAKPYITKEQRIQMENESLLAGLEGKKERGLRFEAYQIKSSVTTNMAVNGPSKSIYDVKTTENVNNSRFVNETQNEFSLAPNLGGSNLNKWSTSGYSGFQDENESDESDNETTNTTTTTTTTQKNTSAFSEMTGFGSSDINSNQSNTNTNTNNNMNNVNVVPNFVEQPKQKIIVPKKPRKTKEEKKREKVANLLFGGEKVKTRKKKPRKSLNQTNKIVTNSTNITPKNTVQKRKTFNQQQQNIMTINKTNKQEQFNNNNMNNTNNNQDVNLINFEMFSSNTNTNTTTSTTKTSTTNMNQNNSQVPDLMDIFGGSGGGNSGMMNTQTTNILGQTTNTTSNNQNLGGGGFGSFDFLNNQQSLIQTHQLFGNFNRDYINVKSKSTNEPAVLLNDGTLSCKFIKLYAKDQLIVLVELQNIANNNATDIAITIDYQNAMKTVMTTDPVQQVLSNGQINVGRIASNGKQNFKFVMSLKENQNTFFSTTSINFRLSYRDPNEQTHFHLIQIPINIGDCLRPKEMLTQQFGSKWNQTQIEKQFNLMNMSNIKSIKDFVTLAKKILHLFEIQIIGKEVIMCSNILGNENLICLFHGMITDNYREHPSISCKLKTNNNSLAECIRKFSLKEFKK